MAKTHFKKAEINTYSVLPQIGSVALDFSLVKNDLSNLSLKDYKGKKIVLNIFPSLDTSTCAASVRNFNKEAASLKNTVVLCISKDLPFAQARFCGAEGIKNAITASEFRDNNFSNNYGVRQIDGPMKGLLARAVIVIDEKGVIKYTQLVNDIADEPDYKAALAAL